MDTCVYVLHVYSVHRGQDVIRSIPLDKEVQTWLAALCRLRLESRIELSGRATSVIDD